MEIQMSDERDVNSHFIHAVLRERIIEHIFIGDILRRLWQRNVTDVEVLRSEFDAGGYDLVLSRRNVVRHIQLKSVLDDGKAAFVKVSLNLAEKASGCVIWIVIKPSLELKSYRWFGGQPGEPLPNIHDLKIAKHTKGTSKGDKLKRQNQREIPRARFERLDTIDDVLAWLFGSGFP
jgi:hypothetical protein